VTSDVLGIDLGASAVHCVRLTGTTGALRVTAVRTFAADDHDGIGANAAAVDEVAIDAPGALSTAVHRDDPDVSRKFRVARCGEIALGQQARIWVPWVTPPVADDLAPWMGVGFAVWTTLQGAGHAPVEVYPAGVFRVLAGHVPPRKTTSAGRAARLALLAAHVDLPDDVAAWSHDTIDATAAALTAHHKATGRARAHGHGAPGCDGSAIWLPEGPRPT
jgi:hypothetical protein